MVRTPGPWHVYDGSNIRGLEDEGVAVIAGSHTVEASHEMWQAEHDRDAANARLIAAAPSLLLAAEVVASAIESAANGQGRKARGVLSVLTDPYAALIGAIKQAKGEA